MNLPAVDKEVCETIFAQFRRDPKHVVKVNIKFINEQNELYRHVFQGSQEMVQYMYEKGIDENTIKDIEVGYLTMCSFVYSALSNQAEVNEMEESLT